MVHSDKLYFRNGLSEWFVGMVCRNGLSEWFVGMVCRNGLSEWFVGMVCRNGLHGKVLNSRRKQHEVFLSDKYAPLSELFVETLFSAVISIQKLIEVY